MKYQIGEYMLDTHTRTLSLDGNSKHIRPKTLTLLLYLAQRPGEIISKQTLLDSVWDDVQVDDGVIFQSVREIRQLFDDPQILLNHPRKGYEWTVALHALPEEPKQKKTPPQQPLIATKQDTLKRLLLPTLALLTLITSVTFWLTQSKEVSFEQRVLVLPIQNHIPYGDHSWLYLGGMEQLISRLDGLPQSSLVFSGDYVPRLMSMAGAGRNYTTEDIAKLFRVSGASIIVATQAHGNAADYKLIYTFHTQNDSKQGVVLTDNFADGFEQLAEKLANELQQSLGDSQSQPQQEFSDALFAQAMLTYETDWQTSVSFFQSYLTLNPKSTMAAIYLSKLYIWQNQLDSAQKTIQAVSQIQNISQSQQAEISLILGRIAAKQQRWQQAHEYFQQAQQTAPPFQDWLLKANIAEEQGLTFIAQNNPGAAIEPFQQALEYYHITQSPIGINSVSLHLSGAYFQEGELEKGREAFEYAKSNIETQGIEFLEGMLGDYQRSYKKAIKDR